MTPAEQIRKAAWNAVRAALVRAVDAQRALDADVAALVEGQAPEYAAAAVRVRDAAFDVLLEAVRKCAHVGGYG